jgi:hypothetical protein
MVIVRRTILREQSFDYSLLFLTLVGVALIAWGLRQVFWYRDSN